jgi:hypothetical protein
VERAEVLTDNVGVIHTEMKQVVQNVKVFLTEAEAAAGTGMVCKRVQYFCCSRALTLA